jgi:hypothetical protein
MAIGTLIIARDFFLAPEELASVHVIDKVKWPATIQIGSLFMAVGLVSAAGSTGGLAARRAPSARSPAGPSARAGRSAALDRCSFDAGRYGLQAAVAARRSRSIFAQGAGARAVDPPVVQARARVVTKFARPGDKIGKYRIEGTARPSTASRPWSSSPAGSRGAFLRDPERRVRDGPTDDLAALDAAFKQAKVYYYVADASSSRFLLLTNRLARRPGRPEPAKNTV